MITPQSERLKQQHILNGRAEAPVENPEVFPQIGTEQLAALRGAFKAAQPKDLEPQFDTSLSAVVGAVASGSNSTLGFAIYEAIMGGLDVHPLVIQTVSVMAAYLGAGGLTRFNTILVTVIKTLRDTTETNPGFIQDAIGQALPGRNLPLEPDLLAPPKDLTAEDIDKLRAGYNDNQFSAIGAKTVTGSATNLSDYIKFVNNHVYHQDRLANQPREAMILACVAGRFDLFGTAIHCYAALGVGLSVQNVHEILQSVGGQAATVALAVLAEATIVMKTAMDAGQTTMGQIVPLLAGHFLPLQVP